MIAATIFSLLFVPTFFVVFQRLAEFRMKKPNAATAEASLTSTLDDHSADTSAD